MTKQIKKNDVIMAIVKSKIDQQSNKQNFMFIT